MLGASVSQWGSGTINDDTGDGRLMIVSGDGTGASGDGTGASGDSTGDGRLMIASGDGTGASGDGTGDDTFDN